MATIKVQSIPVPEIDPEELLIQFIYKYPQYTLEEARRMPYKQVMKMLRVARKIEAAKMLDLTQIIASPHTKNGDGVLKMVKYYHDILDE